MSAATRIVPSDKLCCGLPLHALVWRNVQVVSVATRLATARLGGCTPPCPSMQAASATSLRDRTLCNGQATRGYPAQQVERRANCRDTRHLAMFWHWRPEKYNRTCCIFLRPAKFAGRTTFKQHAGGEPSADSLSCVKFMEAWASPVGDRRRVGRCCYSTRCGGGGTGRWEVGVGAGGRWDGGDGKNGDGRWWWGAAMGGGWGYWGIVWLEFVWVGSAGGWGGEIPHAPCGPKPRRLPMRALTRWPARNLPGAPRENAHALQGATNIVSALLLDIMAPRTTTRMANRRPE